MSDNETCSTQRCLVGLCTSHSSSSPQTLANHVFMDPTSSMSCWNKFETTQYIKKLFYNILRRINTTVCFLHCGNSLRNILLWWFLYNFPPPKKCRHFLNGTSRGRLIKRETSAAVTALICTYWLYYRIVKKYICYTGLHSHSIERDIGIL